MEIAGALPGNTARYHGGNEDEARPDYVSLWDTWSGIFTVSDATMTSCFEGFWTMSNAHLAKVNGNSKVYVYDVNHGGYWNN